MLKKIIVLLSLIFSSFISYSYEVNLPVTNWDIKSESIINSDNEFYLDISKTITNYLWYILWAVSFGIVLYAWTLLMKSEWDQEELKKANKILVWWLVWIFTSLLAYQIVNLIIKLW